MASGGNASDATLDCQLAPAPEERIVSVTVIQEPG